MLITYTALRSVTADHVSGSEYSIDVSLTVFNETGTPKRNQDTTLDGSVHTLTHYVARSASITTQILSGANNDQMREFIQSVNYGEQFTLVNPDSGATETAILKSFNATRFSNQINTFRYTLQVIFQ